MVNQLIIAVALSGLVIYTFLVVALHQLFVKAELREQYTHSATEPPPVNEAYQGRNIPGSSRHRDD